MDLDNQNLLSIAPGGAARVQGHRLHSPNNCSVSQGALGHMGVWGAVHVAVTAPPGVETHKQEDECQLEGQGQSGNAISGLLAYYCWSGRWCGGREGRHQRGEARLIRRGETPAATTVTVGSFRPFGNGMEIDASCHPPYRDTQRA